MTTAALVVTWWFLAMPIQSATYNSSGWIQQGFAPPAAPTAPPVALGPFPTEAMCVAAGHLAQPSNRDFWTAEQKRKWDAAQAEYEHTSKAYDSWIATLAKLNPKVGHYKFYPDGPEFWRIADTDGTVYTGGSNGCGMTYQHGIGVQYCGGGRPSELVGKGVPVISKEPTIDGYDQYAIKQPCQSVTGWTKVTP